MHSFEKDILAYLAREKELIDALDSSQLEQAMNALLRTSQAGGVIYVCGNGGSAATASHIVNDFNKGVNSMVGAGAFLMNCLSDNISILTAIANDISYEEVFRYQLRNCLRPKDALLAISGSGNSPNVLAAANYSRELGATVVGMTGGDGGRLLPLCHYAMHVPSKDQQLIEDVHMIFNHMMTRVFCDRLKE